MYQVAITWFGKTTVVDCADLTEASFTILDQHAAARALCAVQGRDYEVELREVA